MKKLLALILALSTCILLFAACGGNTEETTTGTPAVTTTAEKPAETTTEAPAAETTTEKPAETTTKEPSATTPKPDTPTTPTKEFDASELVWSPATAIHDATGVAYTYGKNNPSKHRMAMTSYIKVEPGDTITFDSDKFVFILYGYSDADGTYSANSYIDVSPANKDSNWGNTYTFEDGIKFGNGKTVTYPLYVRFTIKEKTLGATDIPENIKDSFTFDIASGEIAPPTIPPVETTTEKPATPVVSEIPEGKLATSVDDLVWAYSVGIYDETGKTYAHVNKESGAQTGYRMSLTSYIKVAPGDTITLDSDKYVFILYGYTDDKGTYEKNNYIDVDPNSTSNWGTTYTFKNGPIYGNGKTIKFPLYVRILIKEKATGTVIVPESIKDSFTFDVASLKG